MFRKVILAICFLILFLLAGCSDTLNEAPKLKPGTTLHYSGKGKVFGAGVNTTIGKYEELVIRSVTGSRIDNINYEIRGKHGLLGSGTISLGSDGYYFGNVGLYEDLSKKDVMSIKLEWDGKVESFDLKNVDR